MNYLSTLIIFALCFAGLSIGLFLSKKVLKKGCSADPNDPDATCACKMREQKEAGIEDSDPLVQIHPTLKAKKKGE